MLSAGCDLLNNVAFCVLVLIIQLINSIALLGTIFLAPSMWGILGIGFGSLWVLNILGALGCATVVFITKGIIHLCSRNQNNESKKV